MKVQKTDEVGTLKILLNDQVEREIPVYRPIQVKEKELSWFDKIFNWFTGTVNY